MTRYGMQRYHYVTMRVDALCQLTQYVFERDAYISDTPERRAFETLLTHGYRWVRTDGDWAVFELEMPPKPIDE